MIADDRNKVVYFQQMVGSEILIVKIVVELLKRNEIINLMRSCNYYIVIALSTAKDLN